MAYPGPPFRLPAAWFTAAGQSSVPPQNTGGYHFLLGGHGFRFATSTDNPYTRGSEPVTVRKYDSSNEPGEQSLSELPWKKSQSSFHGGAGQKNLENGYNAYQYQQEEVSHIRFDMSQGCDVFTPGQVSRLPDCRVTSAGLAAQCSVTSTVAGVDYAVYGGVGGLYQAAWAGGPDAAPTVTQIDLSGSTYGGNANCTVTSLATDGTNYFGVLQMTIVGFVVNTLTYVISGVIGSTNPPTALYECPGGSTAATRHNLCTNPDMETNITGWTATGTPTPTLSQSATQARTGTQSLKWVSGGTTSFFPGAQYSLTTVNATTYTASVYVFIPSSGGCQTVSIAVAGVIGTNTSTTGSWQRISVTFTATGTSTAVNVYGNANATSQIFYMDDVLMELGSTAGTYFSGATSADATYTYAWDGTAQASASTATGVANVAQSPAVVGWSKARLIGGIQNKVYELSGSAAAHSALPTAKYSHPNTAFTYTDVSESPRGVVTSGYAGSQATLLEFTLDTTSGAVPTLSGGISIWAPPPGEIIYDLQNYLSTYLSIGTNRGLRIGEFADTGSVTVGPISIASTKPVYSSAGRDRFIYCSYTNQQPDGKTGLAALDLSFTVDSAGRQAWAPSLRPPTTAATGLGIVYAVNLLPQANRIVWFAPDGIHVEGGTAGSDGSAWVRTSRIRHDTTEGKFFKSGRVTGTLDSAAISITGITPFGGSQNLATVGFVSNGDPGEFALPGGVHEWLQLQFGLVGAGCVLNSYTANSYPAPTRPVLITLSAWCMTDEVDQDGNDVNDPELPRIRYENLVALEAAGRDVQYVEFTNTGPVIETVLIDQMQFAQTSPPNDDGDFGGIISLKLRITE